jgi:NADH-quinone oxidoreductase subunit K
MMDLDLLFEFFNKFVVNYYTLSFLLFILGLVSLYMNKSNVVKILMSFELIVLSIVLNFNIASGLHSNSNGHVFVMLILAIAASESAIGLALFFAYFKKTKKISTNDINLMRG